MSKNKKANNNDLKGIVEKYLVRSRNEILRALINIYKIPEKEADQIEVSVYTSTRSAMREMFTFKYFFPEIEKFKNKNTIFETSTIEYPDFVNWTWIALHIPFYQSMGDTIGYNNGNWEFNYGDIRAGPDYVSDLIYEFISLGGINDLRITNWLASDDTVMYLATMDILSEDITDINDFGEKIKQSYIGSKKLLENRDPGETTMDALSMLETIDWDKLPYNNKAIGAGSAMRCGCIGIFFPGKHNRKKLISLAVESSRITHNSAIAILGSVTAALFTAYSLERVPIPEWPHKLLKLLKSKLVDDYMEKSRPKEYSLYVRDKILYVGQWEKYVNLLFTGIKPRTELKFMEKNPVQRYKYLSENFSKGCDIPGACGDDALIMAYDALLRSNGVLEKIIVFSILHPGDSDTVGSIAFSWFGGYYHSPRNEIILDRRFEELEFYQKLQNLLEKNIEKMAKVYYYDIYMNIARKYLKPYIKK